MANPDETTLLIKLHRELKTSFSSLCARRGVSVSEEMRRLIANELVSDLLDMVTHDRAKGNAPTKKTLAVKKATKQTKANADDQTIKNDKTNEIVEDKAPVTSQKEQIDAFNDKQAQIAKQNANDATQGKMRLGDGVMGGIKARDSRNQTKK